MSNNLNKILNIIKINKEYLKNIKRKKLFLINNKNLINLNNQSTSSTKNEDKVVIYIIYISFSKVNTRLHIMDYSGKMKFFYSAGSFSYSGKKKRSRIIILKDFLLQLK